MDKSSVKVTIYGSEYVIKGDDPADHIEAIASFVDQKMKEINKSGVIKSPLKVAILAALNITDEYFKTSADQKHVLDSVESKTQKLLELLNQAPTTEPEAAAEVVREPEEISLFSQK